MFGSMIPSRVWTPSFALSRSVHSPLGPVGVHIDPVRSTTSMMSTGADEHGWQAVATPLTSKWLKPRMFANQVGVVAVSVTAIVFAWKVFPAPHQLAALVEQRVVTETLTLFRLSGVFSDAY